SLEPLRPICPKFFAYAVSFVYVGIYWNNHHHLLHTVKKVDGWIMWANMHLLFWLSLVPIAIAIYVGIAIVWLVPDRRITRALEHE
ncbi:MAG TPA: TMEM175 family protein, partial [Kofleriaceae bacterium]|nr:TMEM175 family protein [Kofleriaceae bacterium]